MKWSLEWIFWRQCFHQLGFRSVWLERKLAIWRPDEEVMQLRGNYYAVVLITDQDWIKFRFLCSRFTGEFFVPSKIKRIKSQKMASNIERSPPPDSPKVKRSKLESVYSNFTFYCFKVWNRNQIIMFQFLISLNDLMMVGRSVKEFHCWPILWNWSWRSEPFGIITWPLKKKELLIQKMWNQDRMVKKNVVLGNLPYISYKLLRKWS